MELEEGFREKVEEEVGKNVEKGEAVSEAVLLLEYYPQYLSLVDPQTLTPKTYPKYLSHFKNNP